ncbi:MAG TPA: DUF6184 family natural product biosynthesis lipoprotein [Polyangia bacterium]|nr:DUF6184 family natural product biosynthesis lipoprotein [Polyangia bacterium]
MSKVRKIIGKIALAALVGGLGAVAGCGGVSGSDVVNARNQATAASCAYFQMCGDIGNGKTYSTSGDCTSQVNGNWTSAWPTTTCQGHVDQHQLTVCLDAINSTTDCNGLAVLLTLTKCGSGTVCSANQPPDAGGGG